MNILLLASGFRFQYRVLRCASAAGAETYVLGDEAARGLAWSRHCARFIASSCKVSPENGPVIVEQINALIEQLGIAFVLPTDANTTRLLAVIRSDLRAPSFPMPALDTFDTLNDKSQFAKLCETLGIPHPRSRLLSSKDELSELHKRGALRLPSIAKPLNMFGKIGVLKLDRDTVTESIARIDYQPILVQDFLDGQDICISLFLREGRVLGQVTYLRKRGTFYFIHNETLSMNAQKIGAHFRYDGVLAFDARLSPDGQSVGFIECNPRFWYNMDVAMIAGINFVKLGLDEARDLGGRELRADGKVVRLPKAFLAGAITPWKLTYEDVKMLRYCLSDPIPFALIGARWGSRSNW